jgi:hypothetical protein
MATWIVHLRLAENILGALGNLSAPEFALGNIAPDSGIPDEKWENFSPPKEITHFLDQELVPFHIADLEFYRNHLLPHRSTREDSERTSFLLGYFFHLITDNLWAHKIGKPTLDRFSQEFKNDPNFAWEIKRDWYGLDFDFIRSNPKSLFWRVFLDTQYTQDFLDFLPGDAIRQQIKYIKTFYQRTDDEVEERFIQRPNLYLSQNQMDAFIEQTTQVLLNTYSLLWQDGIDTQSHTSILDML